MYLPENGAFLIKHFSIPFNSLRIKFKKMFNRGSIYFGKNMKLFLKIAVNL